jgi:hypothetical protein
MDDAMHTGGAAAAAQPIDGRAAFRAALLVALDDCAQADVPEIWLCDPDFVEWPLGQAEVVTALSRWVTPRRRLTLVAGSYEHLAQRCPRWVAWRRQWGHAVHCLQVREEAAAQMPTLLYGPPAVALRMQRMERVLRGRLYRDADDLAPLADLVDALTQRTHEAFPVTTLGL